MTEGSGGTLVPDFTDGQGWWLLGTGMAALVGARLVSGALAAAFFLVGMALLLIAAATFIRVETEVPDESEG
jgi:hypothetical protein